MTRSVQLLTILGALLLVVLWFLFLFRPASDDLADANAEIQATQDQQAELQAQIERLKAIRADVTSIEAELAAYNAVVPDDPALPSLLRQLQSAADDSGLELASMSPGTPAILEEMPDVLSMSLAIEVSGGYFQLVDFLRRIENPVIVGRGVLFDGMEISIDEYPTLTVGLTGRVFTTGEFGIVPEAPDEDPNPSTGGAPGATETATETASPATETPQEVTS